MRFVREHEEVRRRREQRELFAVATRAAFAAPFYLLELVHRRENGLPRRPREKLAKVAHALGLVGVRKTASYECLRELLVEIFAVRDDHERRILVHGVAP